VINKIIIYVFLIILSLLFVFPFLWMILSSFKANKEVLAIPVKIFPEVWTIDAYLNLASFAHYDFSRYFLNSIFVTVLAVFFAVILCTTAGYGFAKYKFPGNNFLFFFVLSTIMIPFQAIVVPLFILMKDLGLQNSYLGLFLNH